MQDLLTHLTSLTRPSLMMRAVRLGVENYRRTVHLPRLLGYGHVPQNAAALVELIDIEGSLEEQRKCRDASYSMLRHIDILIAMVAEAHMLRATSEGPSAPAHLR